MKDSSTRIRVGFIGVNGRMCQSIIDVILNDNGNRNLIDIVAGVEKEGSILVGKRFEEIPGYYRYHELSKTKVYKSIDKLDISVDVWIDFSSVQSTMYHLKNLKNHNCAYLIGTTGFTKEQTRKIKEYAKKRVIVMSGNFSVGINLILFLLEKVLQVKSSESYDIEVSETHHRMKLDAPSGTAKMILEKIKDMRKLRETDIVYNRKSMGPHLPGQIGMTSKRGGGVVGEHEICFYENHEFVSLKHHAIDRAAFANGVVRSIFFAYEKSINNQTGFFGIKDVLNIG